MKRLLYILILTPTALAHADLSTVNRTLKDTTTFVALALNSTTVFCTHRGYSSNQMKISVPQLDELAHFNHRVAGEAQPCMSAGFCADAATPATFLDAKQPLMLAPIRVVLEETLTIDNDKKTCTRYLSEHVTSLLKGLVFRHEKVGAEESVSFDTCTMLSSI